MMAKSIQQINQEFIEECLSAEGADCPGVPGLSSEPAASPAVSPPRPVWKDLLTLFMKITSIILAFIVLFTFLFGITRYQDPSMAPAVKDGDLVIFFRPGKSYLQGDAVAVKKNGQIQVRRVAAVAGDTVDITQDGLVINGALQQEPDIYSKTQRYAEGIDFPLTVPEGQVFVLGDSRDGATDSRIYGCMRVKDTLGEVMTVIRRRDI